MKNLDHIGKNIVDAIVAGADKWEAENPDYVITQNVMNILEQSKEDIIKQLLGFTQDYPGGAWKIDRTYDAQPVATQFMLHKATDAINTWFDQIQYNMPIMDWQMEENFKRELKETYELEFKEQLSKRVTELVKVDVDQIMSEIKTLAPQYLDKVKQVQRIINNEYKSGMGAPESSSGGV